jgi:glyoxylase-like metal-dependent hydrolase (beta-lactamase superfamily II)
MTIRIGMTTLFCASALLAASAAQAQQQRPDFSKVEIKTIKLADNFYALEGQGGVISVLTGPDGVLLVDSQFAPLTDKLVAAIRQVSDRQIRFLVNTHLHGDHTGGNENFAKLGAVIFARQQVRERLSHPAPSADGTPGKAAVAEALPVVTYDDAVTIHLDGENVGLLPVRNAHTDGDTLVSFPEHDILAVGDFYRSVGYPIADLNNGGSLNGLLEALRVTIERAGPNTKIIPGHGPIVDRNAVIAQRDLLIAYRDKVAVLVGQNKTLEEVLAAKITADTDAQIPQSAQTAERFVKWLYSEVKAAKAKA